MADPKLFAGPVAVEQIAAFVRPAPGHALAVHEPRAGVVGGA